MYFAYGWPRSLALSSQPELGDVVYIASGPDFLVIVFAGAIQIWTGGQHHVKVGELVRSASSLQEEGDHLKAYWSPGRKCLAVLTDNNHLLYYGLLTSKEALWHFPDGREAKKVSVYLQNSLHLDYGAAANVVDLAGDGKSVVAVLSSGALQVFSWQGQLRGQANPFTAAAEGSGGVRGGRMGRTRSGALHAHPGSNLSRHSSSAASMALPTASGQLPNGNGAPHLEGGQAVTAEAANGSAGVARSGEGHSRRTSREGRSSLHLSDSFPATASSASGQVCVRAVHWAPATRLLAAVLEDGRCALCRTPASGMQHVEQVHLLRWVYHPPSPPMAAVAAAIAPEGHLLAVGLSHGRVALYPLQGLLSPSRGAGLGSMHSVHSLSAAGLGSPRQVPPPGPHPTPDPLRVLSLTDWGYSSTVTGAAAVLRWSPDGRVLAVGYGRRGVAVWTPSGCRLMCSLRQAAPAAAPHSAALQPGIQGHGIPATPRPVSGGSGTARPSPAATPLASSPQEAEREGKGGGLSPTTAKGSPASPRSSPQLLPQPSAQGSGMWQPVVGEAGVLEGVLSTLCWGPRGYQLLMAEACRGGGDPLLGTPSPPRIFEQDFAQAVPGQHRAAPAVQPAQHAQHPQQQGGVDRRGQQGVHALQGADRILLVTESHPTINPDLVAQGGAAAGAELSQRPDLTVQHLRVPQQYMESNYPLVASAVSHQRGDVAVAGTRGFAVYVRRAQRWRMFGDVTQERQLRVHRLLWLPGGVVAACAFMDSKEGGGAPQLLLYPRSHLDSGALLAKMQLKEMPLAVDSVGPYLLLAFSPLELRVVKVEVEGGGGPLPLPTASSGGALTGSSAPALPPPSLRLTTLRELSIMGLGSPLQDIALLDLDPDQLSAEESDPPTWDPSWERDTPSMPPTPTPTPPSAASEPPAAAAPQGQPQLAAIATKPRRQRREGSAGKESPNSRDPVFCVVLRAGGVMSLLNMEEGTEQILSDEIEHFWLPGPSAQQPQHAQQEGGGLRATSPGLAQEAAGQLWREGSLLGPPGAQLDREDSLALPADAQGHFRVEMPWWTYGARGMQLWFPSTLSEPLTPLGGRAASLRSAASGPLLSPSSRSHFSAVAAAASTAAARGADPGNSTDPELEFDREVYPIGVSLAEVSIVGVTQRTVRSAAFAPQAPQALCFLPLPESQPVLPCLLRRLLQKGKESDALALARQHASGPHFGRSLEWLLFTSLELDCETQKAAGGRDGSGPGPPKQAAGGKGGRGGAPAPRKSPPQPGPLLRAAAHLVQQFPQFAQLVVSVARKTDATLWPPLFAAVGSPSDLGEGLRVAGDLQSAACCLLLVDHIEGTEQAHALALRLMRAALKAREYQLVGELFRFLVPPGESDPPASGLQQAEQAAQQQQQQQQQQGRRGAREAKGGSTEGYGSWLWGVIAGGGRGGSSEQQRQHGGGEGKGGAPEGCTTDAGQMLGRHAWKLLDSGALRELAALNLAVGGLRGGLPALMAAASIGGTARLAQPHRQAAAAGVASALFVALNEFPSLDADLEAVAAAEALLCSCQEAGCHNHAAALALLLGDDKGLAAFEGSFPQAAAELTAVLERDAYLRGYAELLGKEGGGQRDELA